MRYLASLILTLFALIVPTHAAVPLVEIYTIPGCTGCNLAKAMFDGKGIPYKEINLQGRRDLYLEMKQRVYAQMAPSDRRDLSESMTVPRIFISGKYIGNYSDLNDATLDKLVTQNKSNPNDKSADPAIQTDKNDES
jgi:glutaredoxin